MNPESGSQIFVLWTLYFDQVVIAKWLARQLATGEVPVSNPGKGDNLINF